MCTYSDGEVLIILVSALVLVVDGLDFHGHLLHLVQPGIIHPLLNSVLLDQLLNVKEGLLQAHLQQVDLLPQLQDSVLVNISLNPTSQQHYLCSFSPRSFSCCNN